MSSLEEHTETELRRAGLFDKDSDYGGMLAEAVMKLVRVHAAEGHSGFSHGMAIQIFNKVINFKTLTPLTDNPDEWTQLGPDMMPEQSWQSRRQSSCFSKDGGKTWYDIDEQKETFSPYTIHTSTSHLAEKEKQVTRSGDVV